MLPAYAEHIQKTAGKTAKETCNEKIGMCRDVYDFVG